MDILTDALRCSTLFHGYFLSPPELAPLGFAPG